MRCVFFSDGSSIKNIMDQVVINAGGQPTEVELLYSSH